MKKLLLSFLSLYTLAVTAADFVVNGIAYNALSLTDLTCEVTGNSTPYSGNIEIPTTVSYQNRTFKVIGIGEYAFSRCYNLTSLILPNTLKMIGRYAFLSCSNLRSLSIPGSVGSIDEGAFEGCINIKKLRLEDGGSTLTTGRTYRGSTTYGLFYYCNIDTLYLGRNLSGGSFHEERPGYTGVSNKNTLSEVTIGHCVSCISPHTFQFSKFKKIVIPSSVKIIRDDAFQNCAYEELVFEDGDTPIELGIHTYSDDRFEYCVMRSGGLRSIYVGREIKLAQVGSSGSTNNIHVHGFFSLSALKNVTIGENVTELPNHLFRDCDGIEKIILPNKLSYLNSALVGCSGIMDITCQSTTPPSVTSWSFTNNQYLNATVKVPEDVFDSYKADEVWGHFWNLTKADSSEIETKQCAKPIINYSNRKLQFSCDTEGAEFHSSISCNDVNSYNENEISLEAAYEISVYATCYGYSQSEVSKAILYWINGTMNTTEIQRVQPNGRGVLVLSNNGFLSISGLEINELVTVYDTSGKMIGSAKAFMGGAKFSVGNAYKIIILKIGNESIKIAM